MDGEEAHSRVCSRVVTGRCRVCPGSQGGRSTRYALPLGSASRTPFGELRPPGMTSPALLGASTLSAEITTLFCRPLEGVPADR
jgi:hypothetical protein